jgi:hypothetical protein
MMPLRIVKANLRPEVPVDALKPLEFPTDGRTWYKAMNDAGYGFGPAFYKQIQVETVSGLRRSRAVMSLEEPVSSYTQSLYPMHPAVMDGCLQTTAPSLWCNNRSDVDSIMIPAIIDELVIHQRPQHSSRGMSISTSEYTEIGRRDDLKSYKSKASVYDAETSLLLFEVSGMGYHKLDRNEDVYSQHTYSQVVWKPDVTTLHGSNQDVLAMLELTGGGALKDAHQLLDLVAHKKPQLRVLEINQIPNNANSIWLSVSGPDISARAACRRYRFATVEAGDLLAAQEAYASHGNAEFELLDMAVPIEAVDDEQMFDLVILKKPYGFDAITIANACKFLKRGASLLILEFDHKADGAHVVNGGGGNGEANKLNGVNGVNGFGNAQSYQSLDFISSRTYKDSPEGLKSVSLGLSKPEQKPEVGRINLLHFTKASISAMKLRERLSASGWIVTEQNFPFQNLESDRDSIFLVLEFGAPLMTTIAAEHWEALKTLFVSSNKVLWVTEGCQMEVTNPDKAMIHGLARTVRAEDSSVKVTTLDVQDAAGPGTFGAVTSVLEKVQCKDPIDTKYLENEFVERRGVIYVSRILSNQVVNLAEADLNNGAAEVDTDFHGSAATIRLQCERIGTLDELHYNEVAATELPLEENQLEIEIFAASLNFKVNTQSDGKHHERR